MWFTARCLIAYHCSVGFLIHKAIVLAIIPLAAREMSAVSSLHDWFVRLHILSLSVLDVLNGENKPRISWGCQSPVLMFVPFFFFSTHTSTVTTLLLLGAHVFTQSLNISLDLSLPQCHTYTHYTSGKNAWAGLSACAEGSPELKMLSAELKSFSLPVWDCCAGVMEWK